MLPIQTILLFGDAPRFDPQTASENLINHLQSAEHMAEEINPAGGESMRFRVGGLSITITLVSGPADTNSFAGATDSPLCRQARATLNDCMENHHHHMRLTLDQMDASDTSNPLQQLRLMHQVATFFASLTAPLAIHWCQSNILLTGSQYLRLAGQTAPWTLFAQLHEIKGSAATDETQHSGVRIENADTFVGAPIQLEPTDMSLDKACAAALAFLRHAVQSDIPLGDGQTFGPNPEMLFNLKIVKPSQDHPAGLFQLWEADGQPEAAPDIPARMPGATLNQAKKTATEGSARGDEFPGLNAASPADTEKTRSLALSFLMLALMPAVGAVLLVSNVIFGTNSMRTGLAALVVVALGLVIGAYTFLNVDALDNAVLSQPDVIILDRLQN